MTVDYAKLKKGKQVVTGPKAARVQGAMTYSIDKALKGKTNVKGKFSIDKASGKITIAKGLSAGTYKVTVKATAAGNANFEAGSKTAIVTVKVAKAKNPITFAKKTATVKYGKLKKAKQTVAIKRATKAQGAVTYSIAKAVKGNKSFKAKFSINKKTGKITVKKGTAKGTYKVTVKAKAAGNACYKSGSKKAVITIKVK